MYSKMELVKLLEDSLWKTWSDKVCLNRPFHSKFFKGSLLGPHLNTFSYLSEANTFQWSQLYFISCCVGLLFVEIMHILIGYNECSLYEGLDPSLEPHQSEVRIVWKCYLLSFVIRPDIFMYCLQISILILSEYKRNHRKTVGFLYSFRGNRS